MSSICHLFLAVAVSLLIGISARYEDCENPPAVAHASVQISDDEDSVRASYTCAEGYELSGSTELICNLDTDEWHNDPPGCVKVSAVSNEVESVKAIENPRKRKPKEIPENPKVPPQMASTLDMSCIQAKVKAPEIRYGFVENYDRRRSGDHVYLVAFYTCNDRFEFEDSEISEVYCSDRKWVGELPVCVSVGEYGEGNEEEEYEDYDPVDEDNLEENNLDEQQLTPPQPPQPPQPAMSSEPGNEISSYDAALRVTPQNLEEANVIKEDEAAKETVTDINIIVEATRDPFLPRVLDQGCGPNNGDCEHRCERLLYPGENEPRLKCSCFDGFSLDPYDYSRCHDVDECLVNNGGCEQICKNLPGSFECACKAGLQIDTLTGHSCVDINECLLRNGHGPCQDTCHNWWRGYRCSCDGLPGTQLAYDNANNGGCSHICQPSSLGRFLCLCPGGFRMSDDGVNCIDINECESSQMSEQCPDGCENTHGSFRCIEALNSREDASEIHNVSEGVAEKTCPPGFQATDGKECEDIDECALGTSGCDHCRNMEGSFECTCPEGYALAQDARTCSDINECDVPVVLSGNGLSTNVVPYKICTQGCQNTPGSFVCTCGTREHLLDDRRTCAPDTCMDLSSPALDKTPCAFQCEDLPGGGYMCLCPPGYKLSPDAHNCEVDENACDTQGGYENCAPGGCNSYAGNSSYSCNCPPGYVNEIYTCRDLDECASVGTHSCSHVCLNTDGGYQCSCPGGYRFVAGSTEKCEDIDECQSKSDLCGALDCMNTPGSFVCVCPDGSDPNTETGDCEVLEVDLCAEANGGCSHICLNEQNGTRCMCPSGMLLSEDGRRCIYEDRCVENNGGCEQLCAEGRCGCRQGFLLQEDGASCADVDECNINNGGCHQVCRNHEGGYACACGQGFEISDGSPGGSCLDVDECALGTHNCGEGSTCENLNGSYACLCPPGFAQSAFPSSQSLSFSQNGYAFLSPTSSSPIPLHGTQSCVDVDECSLGNDNCSHFCINFPGYFECRCPPGFRLSFEDNRTCESVNPCLVNNGGCSHTCDLLSDGSSQCNCPAGFALDDDFRTCRDVDECALQNGHCGHVCVNSAGSFQCLCRAGFQLAANERDCEDVDECAQSSANCTFICINLLGSYECACDAGFELADDRTTCIDVDECALGRHDCSHKCVNLEGGYECVCPRNHVLGENKATCLKNTRDPIPAMARCPAHTVPNANGDCVSLNRSTCLLNNGNCSHNCDEIIGCTCPNGLKLAPDARTCMDIDECLLGNGGCSHICVNTFGSYECACREGAKLADARNCAAVCPSGFRNDPADATICLDIDECATPGICQYSCSNYNGSYACVCPKGFTLRNGRECEDIDECLRNNGGCRGGGVCVNLRGSYQCQCHAGYSLRSDGHTCEASTESWRDQCSQLVAPPNGETHCTKYRHKKVSYYNTKCKIWCRPGYRLQGAAYRYCDSSGAWDQQESQCIPIVCPRIPPPSNGVILPASCSYGKSYFGERCRLQCHPGYVPVRKMVAVCTANQVWSTNTTLACVPHELDVYLFHLHGTRSSTNTTTNQLFSTSFLPSPPVVPSAVATKPSLISAIGTTRPTQPRFTLDSVGFDTRRPYIKCPRNTTVVLAHGARTAHIILQKPVTNMDFRYIESYPSWTKDLQAHLAAGTYFITFRGHDPATGRRARCQTVIHVRKTEPPKVDFCPLSFEVTLSPNEVYRPVYWEEPRFGGDAGRRLKKMYKSRIPGELFGSGVHTVYYEATNEAELTARCEFQIIVKAAKSQPSLPLIDFGLTQANRITDRLQSQVSYSAENAAQMAGATMSSQAELLPGHDAYIICPGRAPVKVIEAESVNLRAECVLKNIRVQSSRHQLQRQYSFGRHTSKYYA